MGLVGDVNVVICGPGESDGSRDDNDNIIDDNDNIIMIGGK
jgi:hypothetical protein